jgi:hypothetical protein
VIGRSPMRRRKLSLASVVGWGFLSAVIAYVWVFAFVTVLAAR